MFGAGLDGVDPAPLALAEIRCRQQIAHRENAGERRADFVRKGGKRRLDHAGRRRGSALRHRLPRPFAAAARFGARFFGGRRFGGACACARFRRHDSPDPRPSMPWRDARSHAAAAFPPDVPSGRRSEQADQAANVGRRGAPARSSRKPVARVDFESLRPSRRVSADGAGRPAGAGRAVAAAADARWSTRTGLGPVPRR